MIPQRLEVVQNQVQEATEAQIISYLAMVISWPIIPNDPSTIQRKDQAQEYLNAVLFDGATERARHFLHRLSEQAAARGGWK